MSNQSRKPRRRYHSRYPAPEPNPETPREKAERIERETYRSISFLGTIMATVLCAMIGANYFGPDTGIPIGGTIGLIGASWSFYIFSPNHKKEIKP